MSKPQRSRIFMMDLLATVPYYTAYLSKALLQQGADVHVGSITYYLDRSCFARYGIRLDPGLLDVVGRLTLPRLFRRVLKLLELSINLCTLTVRFLFRPPDIVHVQFLPLLRGPLPLDLWFVRFCRWRGAKIVLTVHDLLPHDTADTYRELYGKLYGWVDHLICHSTHVRDRLQNEFHVPEEKISVIAHGPFFYDLPEHADSASSHERYKSTGEILVLWQGIIFPYKGIDLLLDAWKTVEESVPSATLLIAGTGSPAMLQQIHDQIARLQLAHVRLNLSFVSTEELIAMYRAADIVVYPYRNITTSGALATGLALGKAIVASDLPVFRELLTNGETAFLIHPSDSSDLASALTRLTQDKVGRERLAAKVRKMNFGDQTWLKIADQTIHLYNEIAPPDGMLR